MDDQIPRSTGNQRTVVANKFHTQRIMWQDRQDIFNRQDKVKKMAQSVESSEQTIKLKDSKIVDRIETGASRLPTRTGD